MNCTEARDALFSAVCEVSQRRAAQDHVRNCEVCSGADVSYYEASTSRRISALEGGYGATRMLLAILGIIHLSLSLPWLFGADSWWGRHADAAEQHLTRDGMIALVFAVAALSSAWSRRFAWFSLLPVGLALVVQVLSGWLDHHDDHVHLGFEWIHLLGFAVLALIVAETGLRQLRRS